MLEYAGNGNLFFYIHAKVGLPENLALRFLYQTALAVQYMHERNIIHRDIKPENILLDDTFNVKLCDFGWSCRIDDDEYRNSVCGTYEYMSPEIVYDKKHNKKVDIWCLGILLYEMLHGNPPHKVQNLDQLQKEWNIKGFAFKESISHGTRDLLNKLLTIEEKSRPNIEDVLAHPSITSHIKEFDKPLIESDFELLLRNYLMNTKSNNNKHMPTALNSIHNQVPETVTPKESVTSVLLTNFKYDQADNIPKTFIDINNFTSKHDDKNVQAIFQLDHNQIITKTPLPSLKNIGSPLNKQYKSPEGGMFTSENVLNFKLSLNASPVKTEPLPVENSLTTSLTASLLNDIKSKAKLSDPDNLNNKKFNPLASVISVDQTTFQKKQAPTFIEHKNEIYQPPNSNINVDPRYSDIGRRTIYATNNPSVHLPKKPNLDSRYPTNSQSFHLVESGSQSFSKQTNPLNVQIEKTNQGFITKNVNTNKSIVPTDEYKKALGSKSYSEYDRRNRSHNAFDMNRLSNMPMGNTGDRPRSSQISSMKYVLQNGQLITQNMPASDRYRSDPVYGDVFGQGNPQTPNPNRNIHSMYSDISFKKNMGQNTIPVYFETANNTQQVHPGSHNVNPWISSPKPQIQYTPNPNPTNPTQFIPHRDNYGQVQPNPRIFTSSRQLNPTAINPISRPMVNNNIPIPSYQNRAPSYDNTRQVQQHINQNHNNQIFGFSYVNNQSRQSNPNVDNYRSEGNDVSKMIDFRRSQNNSFELLNPARMKTHLPTQRISLVDRSHYGRY